jgi:hypothetical protein
VGQLNQLYDTQIAYMDGILRELLAFLRKKGLYVPDRDVLVLNADHGEFMGEHGYCSFHGFPWEEIIHTPLVMSGPGLPRGSTVDELVANIDIVPTLLDLVAQHTFENREIPRGLEGVSLLPATRREDPVRDRIITDISSGTALCSVNGTHKMIVRKPYQPHGVKNAASAQNAELSGAVSYKTSRGVFRFEVPASVFEGRDVVDFELDFRFMAFGNISTVSGHLMQPHFDLVTAHTREQWDTNFVPWGPREWRLVVKDSHGEVVYDSESQHGWVAFEPLKSPDFDLEIYDLATDPAECHNIARAMNPEYVRDWLGLLLAEYEEHTGKHFQTQAAEIPEIRDFSEEELENIEQLGYL